MYLHEYGGGNNDDYYFDVDISVSKWTHIFLLEKHLRKMLVYI